MTFRITDDPANSVEIDLHITDAEGDAWLEIRNDDWVIKRFVSQNTSRTNVVEIRNRALIKKLLIAWLNQD